MEAARSSTALQLDLGQIATELVGPFQDLLQTTILKLDGVNVETITDAEIRLVGRYRLPLGRDGILIGIEAWFKPAGNTVDYTWTCSPLVDWRKSVSGELKALIALLPLAPDTLWFTISSIDIAHARVRIPGREIVDAAVARGTGFLFRFKSTLLKSLSLEDAIYAVQNKVSPIQFSTNLAVRMKLPPLLELNIEQLALLDARAIRVTGQGKLSFFGLSLSIGGSLSIADKGFSFRLKVPDEFVALFNQAFFRGLKFRDTSASFDGTLSAYTVGLAGAFKVAGSGHGGHYEVKYGSASPPDMPQLFQLSADSLTLSDLFTVMTGVVVRMPDLLDKLVVLERSFLYYATVGGLPTLSGLPSVKGAIGRSDVSLLGYKAHGEIAVQPDDQWRARILLSPIEFGTLLRLRGSGEATPQRYAGTRVGPNAIVFALDIASQEASADITVQVLGQPPLKALARIEQDAMRFNAAMTLPAPMGSIGLDTRVKHQSAQMRSTVEFDVVVDHDWIGLFRIVKPAKVRVSLNLEARPGYTGGEAHVAVDIGPVRFAFDLPAVPAELQNLPQTIVKEVSKRVIAYFAEAVNWMAALLEGTIKYVGRRAELAMIEAGEYLKDHFNKVGKEAARVLKQAGYTAEQALRVFEGQKLEWEDLMHTLKDAAAYTEREVIDGIRKLVSLGANLMFQAHDVASVLYAAGLDVARIIDEVYHIVNRDLAKAVEVFGRWGEALIREVGQLFKMLNTPVKDAVDFVARAFTALTKEELIKDFQGLYSPAEISRAIETVFRESGRVIGNIRNEVERFWQSYTPRVTIGGIKW